MEKKNKHKLLILTGKYPYATGESFLANELSYIPDFFDEVIIYPVLVYDPTEKLEVKYTNISDSRIRIIVGNEFKKKICLIDAFTRSIFCGDFWGEIKRLIHEKGFSVSKLKVLLLFSLRCNYSAKVVKDKIINKMTASEDLTLYSYWMDYDAYTAVLIKRKNPGYVRKTVTRCHRGDLYESAARGGFLPMRYEIFDTMNRIYSISDDGIEYLKQTYPNIIRDTLEVSRLGTFDQGLSNSKEAGTLRVVSCSWVRPVKRVHLIAEALKNADFSIEWTHIGSGSAMGELQRAVDDIGNNLHVKANLTGEKSNEQVMDMYSNQGYQIFINVSENEGVPVSIMEAMSFGMIIIATDVGGNRELIQNGENGYLLDKNFRVKELTNLLKRLSVLSSESLREMGAMSRKIWLKKYSADDNYRKFYEDLIE